LKAARERELTVRKKEQRGGFRGKGWDDWKACVVGVDPANFNVFAANYLVEKKLGIDVEFTGKTENEIFEEQGLKLPTKDGKLMMSKWAWYDA
jgi:hypothetical protein